MPSLFLGNRWGRALDVVGQRINGAVNHVGLLAADMPLTADARARVHHMGPPLSIGGQDAMDVHMVGWLELTRDERDGLQEWLADMRTLVANCYYIAAPAVQKRSDPITKRTIGWKFSCAGFVHQAYHAGAEIVLVAEEHALPPLDYEKLSRIWGDHPSLFHRWGLKGDGPWQVLVPGYLIHALRQPRERLPYIPGPEHSDFSR